MSASRFGGIMALMFTAAAYTVNDRLVVIARANDKYLR